MLLSLVCLAYLVNNGNTFSGKTIYLGNDIDLDGREWTPIGKGTNTDDTSASSNMFSGTFNGNYHVIYNMTIRNAQTTFSGLFGYLESARISNLGIENGCIDITRTVSYRTTAGILAGGTNKGTVYVSNCYVTGTVSVVATGGNIIDIGGFIGDCYKANIENCYCVADVSASGPDNQMVGVFLGWFDAGVTVKNSFSYGECVATGRGSKFVGAFGGGSSECYSVSNVYYCSSVSDRQVTKLTASQMNELSSFNGWDFDTVWEFRTGYDYPVLQGFGVDPDPHTHEYEETSRTDATCTTDGVVTYTCSCGDTKYEIIPAFGHNIATVIETQVTCTTDGLIIDRCTNDGCEYEKRTVIHGEHNYSITDRQEATCEVDGYIEYTCSNCEDKNYEYISGMHNYVETSRVEAQVEVEGSITYTCTYCGDSYSVAIPAITPVLKNSSVLLIQDSLPWAENVNVTLLEMLKTRGVVSSYNIINTSALASCDLSQYGVVFIANDQTTAMYNRLAANAEKLENYVRAGGNLIYGACDEGWGGSGSLTHALPGGVTTSNYYSVHNYIVNDLHPIVTGVYTDNRSLKDELLKGNYCSHTYFNTTTLPEGANIIIRDANGNPTLVEYSLGEGTVIASGLTWEYFYVRNHYGMETNYSKYVYDDLVTYMVYMSNTCEHSYEIVETVEATCEENGYTKYVCTLCSYEYMGDIVIATGHDHVETSRTEATCITKGEIVYTCACGDIITEEIDYVDHIASDWIVDVAATCVAGSQHKECTVCHTTLETETIAPVLDHVAGDWIVDVAATCVAGSQHKECSVCHTALETEEIPPVSEHIASGWIVDLEPTATQNGRRHKECTVCHTVLEVETTPVLAKLVIGNVETDAGSTIRVTIDIQNNPGIIGALLTISYDPALTLINAEAGSAWGSLSFTKPNVFSNSCNFVWDGVSGADYNNGTILVLTFEVPDDVDPGTVYGISASYTYGNMLNEDLEAVNLEIESGSITVINLIGDVNDDGVVDVADVIVLRRYLAGGYDVEIDEDAADMDEDGNITVADLVLLRRYLVA